jgi:hypothetical protein
MLDSITLQYDILKVLDKNGKLATVPLKYRTQQSFSKASLYQYSSDQEDFSIEKANLLGTITDKGMLYYVYKFTTDYGTDTPSVAICGPYKPGSSKLNFTGYHIYSNGKPKQTNWQLQAKKMIPALQEQNKSDLKNNN